MASNLESVLDRRSLRRMAGARSFARGEEYFADGQVGALAEHQGTIVAKVQGTRTYRVKLRVENGDLGFLCACPVGDPPFDRSDLNPGYIRGYVPGVRENGGQYTHAAIWAAMAFAALGDGWRAWELMAMINPVNHARSPEGIPTYKVEPYVVAADVYALSPHQGRGGWTWYTGSAGWMYRLIVESLLGLRLEVDKLRFSPCLPADWKEFKVYYRYRETVYEIAVLQRLAERGETSVTVDGIEQPDKAIPLVDDRQKHSVEVVIHHGT